MSEKKHRVAMILGILIIIAFLTGTWAQDHLSTLEGWKPYTPSRLQWLALELNAALRVRLSEESGYSMDFVPIENEDAILIYVRYLPSVNREVMNISINSARDVILIKVESYGWTSWLKVKEDIKLAQPRR